MRGERVNDVADYTAEGGSFRMRGERVDRDGRRLCRVGSSPHARGTLRFCHRKRRQWRIIPAYLS